MHEALGAVKQIDCIGFKLRDFQYCWAFNIQHDILLFQYHAAIVVHDKLKSVVIFIIIKSTRDNHELAIEVSVSNELGEIQCLSGTTAGHVRLQRSSIVGFSLMREHDEYRSSLRLIKFLHWAIMGCTRIYYAHGYTCML